MDATELRALQAPLKQRYKESPDTACIPTHATGDFSSPGVTTTVHGWAGPVRAGLHPAAGGDGSDACSADLLLEALVGCAGVTLRSVATAMGLEVRGATVRADGVWDVRGTLGVDRSVPVGVTDVVVTVDLDAEVDDAALGRLAAATERYCVVGQSLGQRPRFDVRRAAGRPATPA